MSWSLPWILLHDHLGVGCIATKLQTFEEFLTHKEVVLFCFVLFTILYYNSSINGKAKLEYMNAWIKIHKYWQDPATTFDKAGALTDCV